MNIVNPIDVGLGKGQWVDATITVDKMMVNRLCSDSGQDASARRKPHRRRGFAVLRASPQPDTYPEPG